MDYLQEQDFRGGCKKIFPKNLRDINDRERILPNANPENMEVIWHELIKLALVVTNLEVEMRRK